MKKVFSGMLVLSMLIAMLTGCGTVSESSGSSSAQSTAVADEKGRNSVNFGDSSDASAKGSSDQIASGTDTASTSRSDRTEHSGSYEEDLREFYQALNQNDDQKLLGFMYPEKVVTGINALATSGNDLAKTFGDSDARYEITEIVEEGALTGEELTQLMGSFDQIVAMAELVESYGDDLQSMPADRRQALYESKMEAYTKTGSHPCTITEGYCVTVRSLRNGKQNDDCFYAYYVQDEGWKFDSSLRTYLRKSKQSMSNANAKTLYISLNAIFVELEAKHANVSGSYIISSDDSKNVHVPASVDVAAVRKSVGDRCKELQNYDYFALMQDGVCVYAALSPKDKAGYLGTYPISCMPKSLHDHDLQTENIPALEQYSLEDLYQAAKKLAK